LFSKAGLDIKEFSLKHDDGTSHTYYVKFRPGIKEFLAELTQHFDVHVYTMGVRSYATEIAKLMDLYIDDPSKKLFQGTVSPFLSPDPPQSFLFRRSDA
jgi:RNA polymerase II subunit A-like phosphatase